MASAASTHELLQLRPRLRVPNPVEDVIITHQQLTAVNSAFAALRQNGDALTKELARMQAQLSAALRFQKTQDKSKEVSEAEKQLAAERIRKEQEAFVREQREQRQQSMPKIKLSDKMKNPKEAEKQRREDAERQKRHEEKKRLKAVEKKAERAAQDMLKRKRDQREAPAEEDEDEVTTPRPTKRTKKRAWQTAIDHSDPLFGRRALFEWDDGRYQGVIVLKDPETKLYLVEYDDNENDSYFLNGDIEYELLNNAGTEAETDRGKRWLDEAAKADAALEGDDEGDDLGGVGSASSGSGEVPEHLKKMTKKEQKAMLLSF